MPGTPIYGLPYPVLMDPPNGPSQLRALAEATEAMAVNHLVKKGDVFVNVADYGAIADGVTNNSVSIQSAIDNAPAGATLYFPPGNYVSNSQININKPLTILGYGATLSTTSTNIAQLNVTASDVTILGLKIVGVGGSYVSGSHGIKAVGSSWSTPLRNLTIRDVEVSDQKFRGIYVQYARGVHIDNCYVHNIVYSGIGFWSVQEGSITNCRIQSITNSGYVNNNAYGIELSRNSLGSLSTDPRTSDIAVIGNTVTDVPTWEGIDTHAGQRLRIIGNTVLRCNYGIAIVGGNGTDGNPAYAPLDVVVENNTIASGVTDGSKLAGIQFAGATFGGNPQEYARGVIRGNTVTGHGNDASGTGYQGAIRCHTTRGLSVVNNLVMEPAVAGINLLVNNTAFVCQGNMTFESWTNAHVATAAIVCRDGGNVGQVIGNIHRPTGSKTASVKNQRGLWVATQTNTQVEAHGNYFNVSLPLVGPASIYWGVFDQRTSIEPTNRTVSGSAGGNAALQQLLQILANYGLIVNSST